LKLSIQELSIVFYFLIMQEKKYKPTYYGWDYTKQYTFQDHAQKAHLLSEAALHLMSLYQETVSMPLVSGYDQHLVSHGP
jgi:hypothetical protein